MMNQYNLKAAATALCLILTIGVQLCAQHSTSINNVVPSTSSTANSQMAQGMSEGTSTKVSASSAMRRAALNPVFIQNTGQWDAEAEFLLRTPTMDCWITRNAMVYDLAEPSTLPDASGQKNQIQRQVVRMVFDNSLSATAVGSERSEGFYNYYIGNDPTHWATNVPLYKKAELKNLYAGVDAVFYTENGHPRYDLCIAPGANTSQLALHFEGANNVQLAEDGTLRIITDAGIIEQRGLLAYQQRGAVREKVACAFVKRADGNIGFELGEYNPSLALVIDPLVFSTYLGGSGVDGANALVCNAAGDSFIAGSTQSANFPTVNPYAASLRGTTDAFVTVLSAAGSTLNYSTFYGGSNNDVANGICLDVNGQIFICGTTNSTNLPLFGISSQSTNAGGNDGFYARFSGSFLNGASYCGGSGNDQANAISVGSGFNIFVVGTTSSTNFPVSPTAIRSTYCGGATDAFVIRWSNTGAYHSSTYYGGSGDDVGTGIFGNGGTTYICGSTTSTNLPTQNPFQSTNGGGMDGFYARLSTGYGSVSCAGYIGGSGSDALQSIVTNSSGSEFVLCGKSSSNNFPVLNAFQASRAGGSDAVVCKVNILGTLLFSTYFGGNGDDVANAVQLDASTNIYIAGATQSTSFPCQFAPQSSHGGGTNDAFVARFNSTASTLSYSTYIGGSGDDQAFGVGVDGASSTNTNAYVAGTTQSTNFPLNSAYKNSLSGTSDAFASMMSITQGVGISASARRVQGCSLSDLTSPAYSSTFVNSTLTVFSSAPNNGTVSLLCPLASIGYSDVATGTCPTTIQRTWRATDACALTSTCLQTITLSDTIPPVITACASTRSIVGSGTSLIASPSFSTVSATSSLTEFSSAPNNGSVSDACGVTTVTYKDISSGTACNTTVQRTWTLKDACGNSSSCVQQITVAVPGAPVIVCPPTATSYATPGDIPAAYANETEFINAGGTLNYTSGASSSFSLLSQSAANPSTCSANFSIQRVYKIVDACGQSSTCTQIFRGSGDVPPNRN